MLTTLGTSLPIIQAPMAGVSTPALAAAVSNAGGLGSIGVGATDAEGARRMIAATRALTNKPFNVNLFVHPAPRIDRARERAWLDALAAEFQGLGSAPPDTLRTIYTGFNDDPAMLRVLLDAAPAVASFHFGLPDADAVRALKERGILLLASATSPAEAQLIEAAGLDAIVAQGIEAGGHRGMFNPEAPDDALGTMALTRLLVRRNTLPVIAAGGIMDGAGIRAALHLGAVAAQLGTAFIACPESAADDAYRAALGGPGAHHTIMTRVVSGRPARSLPTRLTAFAERLRDLPVPDYPRAYDAAKQLSDAARGRAIGGYGAQWAGQGAPLSRPMQATALMALLDDELRMSS